MLSLLLRFSINSNLVFLAAFLSGVFLGDYASSLKVAILPSLVFIMTLSTTQITLAELAHLKHYLRDVLFVFAINYVFLSGLILLANWSLIKDDDLYAGFVVMAAIRPALYLFIERRDDGLSDRSGKPLSVRSGRSTSHFPSILGRRQD